MLRQITTIRARPTASCTVATAEHPEAVRACARSGVLFHTVTFAPLAANVLARADPMKPQPSTATSS
ncbi:hypothetical protein GCM10020220_017320 [Nonomuraea rubra]